MKKKNYFLRASVLRIVLSFFFRIPVNAKWVLTRPADVSTSVKQNKTETYVAYLDNDSNRFTSIEAALSAATDAVADDNSKHQVVVIPQTEKQNGKDVAVPIKIEYDCSITNNVELVLPYYKSSTDKTLVTYFDDGGDAHDFENGGRYLGGSEAIDINNKNFTNDCLVKLSATMSIQSGGSLFVNGEVGSNSGNHPSGYTFGHYAELQLSKTAQNNRIGNIQVDTGGVVYSWGFITEDTSNSESCINVVGGKVYEPFVIYDWQGGSKSVSIAVGKNTDPNNTVQVGVNAVSFKGGTREVFPRIKFDSPNIRVKMEFSEKGSLHGRLSIYIDGNTSTEVKALVGESGLITYTSGVCIWDFSLINGNNFVSYSISNHQTKIEISSKYYVMDDGSIKEVKGNGGIGEISVSRTVKGIDATVKTSEFFLPIGSQFDININRSLFNFNKKTMFLPGSKLTISSGSTVNVTEDFAAFYSPDDNGTSSGDAEIINNGRLNFKCDKSVRLWTSYSGSFGAKIKGTGTIASSGSDNDYSNNHSVSLKSNYSGSVVSYKFHLQKF